MKFTGLTIVLAIIVTAVTLIAAPSGLAVLQTDGNVIWTGVFTEEQARRGRENFLISCDRCHAQDLSGLTAPPLKGDAFMLNWEGGSLNRLFTKIRDTMPPTFGSPLTDEAKLEVLAFILETNGFPAGTDDLVLDTARLDAIQLLSASGELPNFSLVQVVGCLAPGTGDTWMLTRADDPVAVGDPQTGPEDLVDARSRDLGTGALRLVSAMPFEPRGHDGHRMAARGLLYRDERESLLNLTSLEMLSSTCGE